MELKIRRTQVIVEERREEAGRRADMPMRKVAAVAVIENPLAGRYVEDLAPLVTGSAALGQLLGELALQGLAPYKPEGVGKGALVGLAGEQEHANALLTNIFAEPLRALIGGKAWISSMTKVAGPGTLIDIPMNCKDALYVRSHYDGMSLALPDTPQADEIAVILVFANRGRLNARVGGLAHKDLKGVDGLV